MVTIMTRMADLHIYCYAMSPMRRKMPDTEGIATILLGVSDR
jgi:hypothetical protein